MLRYMKKYWWMGVVAAMFMVLEVSADLYQPGVMAVIVDDGILGGAGGSPDIALIEREGLKMILVVVLGGFSGVMCGLFANLCGQHFAGDVRKASFRKIMHFSFSQTDTYSTGSLITRLTNDITQIQNFVMQFMRGVVRCLMYSIVGSWCLLSLDISFRTVVWIAIPMILVITGLIILRTSPMFSVLQAKLDHLNSVIEENVNGIRVVRAFVQEDREKKRFEDANQSLVDTQMKVLVLISWLRPLMNIIINLAIVAILWIGAGRARAGSMQPGTIMAAVTYMSQILNGMMMLAMIFQTLSRGIASWRRVSEVLQTEPVIQDGEEAEEPAEVGTISFRDVSFAYPGIHTKVLHGINLDIHSGETLAIVGATGCGKSTLASLIPRFYDATEGTVLVDGRDVKSYPLQELRNKVTVVLQKSELFSTTIRDNIAIGKSGATDEEIRAAAVTAQADGFIMQQPGGYDTAVAEGGMSLSGGQRQRIAIARALLRKSEILIMDDSTSALDLETEAALNRALAERPGQMTRIIIAQRIASVRHADRIAVLDKGAVLACGTHDELYESCPVYRDICDSQLGQGGMTA
ncbi:MAG: ABC transporter ATP-binding protein/permease [Lachnospiraceae bacterium]|jgi:ATP-binding cassette subfamily B protein|nr:ABC transporter ATP-binding protein/permease [Lachnospiraceae bacterium]MCI1398117.1 ABC transporter ATP-binding protein/permease [Lachnospiraceae bacterium]MCI1424258.1 ABC transporter ATP-binding protein/permease [Lachnospiraceae bacterium]MCI1452330.1 ABC transporter ATP-binding protein/permease [Lachnospiraceae bacterium]